MEQSVKYFEIDELPDGRVLAASLSWHSAFSLINDLTNALNEIKYAGHVVIDDTLSKGLHERFFDVVFKDGRFDFTQFKTIQDENLETLRNKWLRKHVALLDQSALTQSEKSQILST